MAEGFSQRAYARHRKDLNLPGGTVRAVQKALASGRIKADAKGKIDPAAADAAWTRNTDEGHRRNYPAGDGAEREDAAAELTMVPAGSGQTSNYIKARTAKEIWSAKSAQLEFERKSGKLIDADEAKAALATMIGAARAKLLGLHLKCKTRIPHLTREDAAVIETLIREALEELSAWQKPPTA